MGLPRGLIAAWMRIAALAGAGALSLVAGEPTPFKRTAPAPSRAAAAAAKLRALPPSQIDAGTDATVPAAVQPLLVEYKEGLVADFLALLRDADQDAPSAVALKQKFVARLKAAGLEPDAAWGDGTFGGALSIEVTTSPPPPKPAAKTAPPRLHPSYVVMVARFAIPCGTDAVLAVYHLGGEGWVTVLRYASERFAEIKDALGNFSYRIAPPDELGNYFVVGAAVSPWCTSNWQGLTVRAYRLYRGVRPALRMYDFSGDAWLGGDAPYRLSAGKEGFSLKFWSWQPLNLDAHHRLREVIVRIDDQGVKRIAPVADTPQDFLAEWFELDWDEARQWVAPLLLEKLETLHRERHGLKEPPELTLSVVQRCPGSAPRWALGLETSHPGAKAGIPDLFLAVVDPGKNLFQIKAIADAQPEDCPGNEPPPVAPAELPK